MNCVFDIKKDAKDCIRNAISIDTIITSNNYKQYLSIFLLAVSVLNERRKKDIHYRNN